MKIILFVLLIICIIFAKWVGIATSWLMAPIANNPYGSILLVFMLIYLIFDVVGLNRKTFSDLHLPKVRRNKDKVGGKGK